MRRCCEQEHRKQPHRHGQICDFEIVDGDRKARRSQRKEAPKQGRPA
jgi:hypothetical protein